MGYEEGDMRGVADGDHGAKSLRCRVSGDKGGASWGQCGGSEGNSGGKTDAEE